MHKILALVIAVLFSPLTFSSSAESPAYDIVMVERGVGGWRAIRYKPDTGQSWYIRHGLFIELLEQKIIPKSEYKILMSTHKEGWGAVRLDINSGDTWKLKSEIWVKIKEAK
jgi:hypothetical protein